MIQSILSSDLLCFIFSEYYEIEKTHSNKTLKEKYVINL